MEGLRRSAWLVVAAALAPLLLFLVFQTGFQAREQRRMIEAEALLQSRSISIAADGEVRRIRSELDALGTAQSLRAGDLDGFRGRATELGQLFGGWRGIELVDRDSGKVLLTVGASDRTVTRIEPGPAGLTGRFAGFVRGAGCPCLLFDRIAHGPPGTHWDVHVIVDTARFNALLPPGKGQYEVSALAGPYGRFIARSLSNDERFGNLGSTYLRRAALSGKSVGIYRGRTLEGFENYTAFARSPETGWSAHVALRAGYIDNPARRFLASIGVAALLAFGLAGILVWFALRQVAEGRRLANRMQQSQKLEALGLLTGGIAHDFNNLLTPIIGSLDLLHRKQLGDARMQRLVDGALQSAERAKVLVQRLLAFARRQPLQTTAVDVGRVVTEISDLIGSTSGPRVKLQIVIEPDLPRAQADGNQLEMALLNLSVNARDAMPDGGNLGISVRRETLAQSSADLRAGEHVVLAVSDTGEGMDADTVRRCIEPFFSTKGIGKGTGLGLSMVHGLAAQLGGALRIHSAPGVGTAIELWLPVADAVADAPAAIAAPTAEEEPSSTGRVLLIDDEELVRAATGEMLIELGYAVVEAASAEAALDLVRGGLVPDLLVTDQLMPGMTGTQFAQMMRVQQPQLPVLIVSGYADVDSLSEDFHHLAKPFRHADLEAALAAMTATS